MTLLKKVSQPIETANGLPNPLYTDPAVYAEESRRLLLGNWSGIAFEGDVPEVGDVYPVELANVPLVVVRGRDREIRVFESRLPPSRHGAGAGSGQGQAGHALPLPQLDLRPQRRWLPRHWSVVRTPTITPASTSPS